MTPLPAARPRIVVVGSLNADLGLRVARHPRPGETLTGGGGLASPGGKGANQACAAAGVGAEVRMIGAVGADAHAEVALSGLRAAGVDLTGVRHEAALPTGLAVVTVAEDGENTIVVVPGANAAMGAVAVREHAEAIREAAVVVLQGEIPRAGIEEAARLCTGRVLLNPAPVLDLDADVLRGADPLVVNEHEALGVLAQLDPAAAGSARGAAPEAVVAALLTAGVRSVVMTLGAAGCVVLEGVGTAAGEVAEPVRVPAARVRAVDTTGAGDAFIGALAARLVDGDGLIAAARHASRVAAFAVTGAGAQTSYPGPGDSLPELAGPPDATEEGR